MKKNVNLEKYHQTTKSHEKWLSMQKVKYFLRLKEAMTRPNKK